MKFWCLGCDIQEWSEWERLRDIGRNMGSLGKYYYVGAQPISHGVPGPLPAIQRAGGGGGVRSRHACTAPPPLPPPLSPPPLRVDLPGKAPAVVVLGRLLSESAKRLVGEGSCESRPVIRSNPLLPPYFPFDTVVPEKGAGSRELLGELHEILGYLLPGTMFTEA